MPRFATIDVGTNSVLLLVADRTPEGRFQAVLERAEITRLGRGVDKSRRLSPEGMEATLSVLTAFAREARSLGAEGIAVSATSAARDAQNGAEFIAGRPGSAPASRWRSSPASRRRSCPSPRSTWTSRSEAAGPLLVIDIGGGSTEFIYGNPAGQVDFRHSFDVGSVRLTERFIHTDPAHRRGARARRSCTCGRPSPRCRRRRPPRSWWAWRAR